VDAEPPLVLVVDDEKAIRDTLCQVLSDENFQAIPVCDGEDALNKVTELHPDVVFLDIWMPGWDGIETLEKIKAVSPATEVIMISGHATISNALEATKRGAFDFIEKPFDIEGILLSTARALERRKANAVSKAAAEGYQSDSSVGHSHASAAEEYAVKNISAQPLLAHRGVCSKNMAGKNLGQRTLSKGTILYGQALHSGQKSGLIFEPLPPNSGIHFGRIGGTKTVPAFVDYVHSTGFATTIRCGSTAAATIEHLMSAFFAYGITNLLVKCNEEVPIFDGSAQEFCRVIEEVGIEEQGGEWFELAVDRPFVFEGNAKSGEEITIEPAEQFSVVYELNYPEPVGKQVYEFKFDGVESFKKEIAPARTFGFMKDIERLQRAGLAAGGRLNNFILIGPEGVVNTELRFPDELVRHKILDILGDLFLLGRPLVGRVRAKMTGHSDNVGLLAKIRKTAFSSIPVQ